MNISSKNITKVAFLLIFLFSCLHVIFYSKDFFIATEGTWPYLHGQESFQKDLYAWSSNGRVEGPSAAPIFLLVSAFFAFTDFLKVSYPLAQIILVTLLTFIGGFSMWVLCKKIFHNHQGAAAGASLFYLSNIFISVKFLTLGFLWFYALVPLLLVLLLKGFEDIQKHKRYFFLFILASTGLSVISTNPFLLVVTLLFIVTWTAVLMYIKKVDRKHIIKLCALGLPIFLLMNSWWVYTHYNIHREASFERSLKENTELEEETPGQKDDLEKWLTVQNDVAQKFKKNTLETSLPKLDEVYQDPLVMLSFFWMIAVITLLLFYEKNPLRKKYIPVFIFATAGGMLITSILKNNENLKNLYSIFPDIWFLKSTTVTALFLLTPVIAPLFGLGLSVLYHNIQGQEKKNIRKNAAFIITALTLFLLLYNTIALARVQILYNATSSVPSLKREVPTDMDKMVEWLNKQEGNYRAVNLSVFDENQYKQSIEIKLLPFLIKKPIVMDALLDEPHRFLGIEERLKKEIHKNDAESFFNTLSLFHIKYLIYREPDRKNPESDSIAEFLSGEKNMKSEWRGGKWNVYVVKQKFLQSFVHSSKTVDYLFNDKEGKETLLPIFFDRETPIIRRFQQSNDVREVRSLVERFMIGVTLEKNPAGEGKDQKITASIPEDGEYQVFYRKGDLLYKTKKEADHVDIIFRNPKKYVLDGGTAIDFTPVTKSFAVNSDSNYSNSFFTLNSDIEATQHTTEQPVTLSIGQAENTLNFYDALNTNLIRNDPSFENSAWEDSLEDCHKYDERSEKEVGIQAKRVKNALFGDFALELSTKDHMACTSRTIEKVNPKSLYQVSLLYKHVAGKSQPFFSIIQRSAKGDFRSDIYLDQSNSWKDYERIIYLNPDTTNFSITLRTLGADNEVNTNLYDYVRIQELRYAGSQKLEMAELQNKLQFTEGTHALQVEPLEIPIRIQEVDPSFESDVWKAKVFDCNNYNKKTLEEVGIAAERGSDATEGNGSLRLKASDHIACTSQLINNLDPGGNYTLSIDYKSIAGGQKPLIRFTFKSSPDEDVGPASPFESIPYSTQWSTFEKTIQVPPAAHIMEITLAAEGDRRGQVVEQFDNLRLKKIITIDVDPENMLLFKENTDVVKDQKNPRVTYGSVRPGKYKVHVQGAQNPYVLFLGEIFNKNWEAYTEWKSAPGTSLIRQLWNKTKRSTIKDGNHYIAQGYSHAWYVEKEGDYDLYLEYKPNRMLVILYYVSGLAVTGMVIYTAFLFLKKKLA